ncbi:DUF1153 domain-containing protein [Erythrobacter sp. JK5]|uniref:DUF1153 domain-containing protein n=1 Tax=Erythrobacter sp. JK5 TaxID=2829500 RepID=UPI001BA7A403|nr:DUF1153 domain-containing protein [Erythrobacter sp. JK5]QUL38260.1 DUF1153 domain-containing protein [Erythrobacter sp. JK5]
MAYPEHTSIADAIKRYHLPESHRVKWSRNRKANVVRAVHDDALSFREARDLYLLSQSEFEQWEQQFGVSDQRARSLEVA